MLSHSGFRSGSSIDPRRGGGASIAIAFLNHHNLGNFVRQAVLTRAGRHWTL